MSLMEKLAIAKIAQFESELKDIKSVVQMNNKLLNEIYEAVK